MKNKSNKPKKDWFTLSKILTYFISVIFAVSSISSLYEGLRQHDTIILASLLGAVTIVASTAVRSYFKKSALEFKLNKMKEMGVEPDSDDFNFDLE